MITFTWTTQKWGRSLGVLRSSAFCDRAKEEKLLSLHLTYVPGQPDTGLGQLLNAAVKRAQFCAMCMWESGTSIGVIHCALAGRQQKEVGEQELLLCGERVLLWKRRELNVLFHPQGSGLSQDTVTYMPLVIQLPPITSGKEASSKRSMFVTNNSMYKVVNGK